MISIGKLSKKKNKLAIINALVVNPAEKFCQIANVYIAGKTIISIANQSPEGFQANEVIDAKNQVVCPGLIDLQARCREPGSEHIATIESETKAALSGGITTLICPPDTVPIIDNKASAELIIKRAKQANVGRVMPVGSMTKQLRGEKLSEMFALKEAGCVAISNADYPIDDLSVLLKALYYAKTIDLPVILKPFESSLNRRGGIHDSRTAVFSGLPTIPRESEIIALQKYLQLVKKTRVKAHISQISCAESVQLVEQAKHEGLEITADVAIHHLFFTDCQTQKFNTLFHVHPPLRGQSDQLALREGLQRGAIDAICSDHRPWQWEHKNVPFVESECGLSGVDTLFYMALKFQQEESLDLSDVLALLTCKPAQCLNLQSGSISVGNRADICIFHPNQERIIDWDDINSHGKNNAFVGHSTIGEVTHTFKSGELIYQRTAQSADSTR